MQACWAALCTLTALVVSLLSTRVIMAAPHADQLLATAGDPACVMPAPPGIAGPQLDELVKGVTASQQAMTTLAGNLAPVGSGAQDAAKALAVLAGAMAKGSVPPGAQGAAGAAAPGAALSARPVPPAQAPAADAPGAGAAAPTAAKLQSRNARRKKKKRELRRQGNAKPVPQQPAPQAAPPKGTRAAQAKAAAPTQAKQLADADAGNSSDASSSESDSSSSSSSSESDSSGGDTVPNLPDVALAVCAAATGQGGTVNAGSGRHAEGDDEAMDEDVAGPSGAQAAPAGGGQAQRGNGITDSSAAKQAAGNKEEAAAVPEPMPTHGKDGGINGTQLHEMDEAAVDKLPKAEFAGALSVRALSCTLHVACYCGMLPVCWMHMYAESQRQDIGGP
jgi:hypothetical protein